MIPFHARPVGFMVSHAAGVPYVAPESLSDARKYPNAALVMEADFGGRILLTCPIRYVTAIQDALRQLLIDLVSNTWGDGIETGRTEPSDGVGMYFELLPQGSGGMGGKGGGCVVDGVYMHGELAVLSHLTEQVSQVSGGSLAHLEAPACYPFDDAANRVGSC